MILKLDQTLFIGKGGQRECYIHPIDNSKVLKVLYRCKSKKEDVNLLEYTYLKILERRNVDFKHLTKCYGYADTNKGKALIFQRVLNFDKKPSFSFREMIYSNKISYELQEKLLDELKNYLEKEKILFIDYSLDNLLLQEYKKNSFKLVIIDGVGAKRFDIKLFIYSYFLIYTSYKIKKQWNKFITEYHFERELMNNLKNYSKTKLNQSDLNLLGKGTGRECFVHPVDNTKVIKKNYKSGRKNDQNLIEYTYYNYLREQSVDFSHISKCYGYQKINDGTKGLVFDRILDYDNNPSKSFRYYISEKLLNKTILDELFNELIDYLQENEILFIDTSLTNIFCKKISENKYKLVIVDGLGSKKFGFKLWLYLNITFYRKYKIRKQIKKLEIDYKSDLERIKKGDKPFSKV